MKPLTSLLGRLLIFWVALLSFLDPANGQEVANFQGVKLVFPTTWTFDTSGMLGTKFMIFSPLEDENDDFRENVNLMIEDISTLNITLEEYMEVSTAQVKNIITDAKIISQEQEEDFYWNTFTGSQGIYQLKFLQKVMLHDGMVYIVTYTSKEVDFDQYYEEARFIIDRIDVN